MLRPSPGYWSARNWRPLFAIAQVVGGPWPQRALDAFTSLNQIPTASVDDSAVTLLGGIRQIFTLTGASRVFSGDLVEALCAMPDCPYGQSWGRNGDAAKLDEMALGRALRPFGVRSRTLRIDSRQAKGYDLADFAAPFARFLNGNPP